jgi:cellulose synthase/poly-beta-1,6-N-acetylglucosamine synthase-like glycosyltransferase
MYAQIIFWGSLIFIAYVYVGYPLALLVWSTWARRTVLRRHSEPTVTMIIAAHNERLAIARRIENCLALDYPKDKLEIIISLDGPTDGTETVVSAYRNKGIRILHSPVHAGKAGALNRALLEAGGEILLFGDARQVFASNAIRELVASFADPQVGAVSGELVLLDEHGGEAKDAIGLYWRYEKKLRMMEGQIHSVVGVTGAIYAIRRELAEPLPEDAILDDVILPMRAVLRGRRAVFEWRARAFDRVSPSPEVEYQRKIRTLMGNYQLILEMPELLVPWRNPVFLQFVSHKLGRLLAPYAFLALAVSNLFLRGYYLIPLAVQGIWYFLVLVGIFISRSPGPRGFAEPILATRRRREI